MTIRVLIAESHHHLREQLVILLDSSELLSVVGEADNGKKAVDLCEKLQPNVVLMGAHLPALDGFAATEMIRAQFPTVRVVIYGNGFLGEDARATQVGASAFLLQPKTLEEIITTIRDVYANNYMRP